MGDFSVHVHRYIGPVLQIIPTNYRFVQHENLLKMYRRYIQKYWNVPLYVSKYRYFGTLYRRSTNEMYRWISTRVRTTQTHTQVAVVYFRLPISPGDPSDFVILTSKLLLTTSQQISVRRGQLQQLKNKAWLRLAISLLANNIPIHIAAHTPDSDVVHITHRNCAKSHSYFYFHQNYLHIFIGSCCSRSHTTSRKKPATSEKKSMSSHITSEPSA